MPIGGSLRFRLLLDLAKEIIFFVDNLPWRFRLRYRRPSQPRLVVPYVGRNVSIISVSGSLDGWFVGHAGPEAAAVLLFHGIGDRISYWRRAQCRLAQAGISSLVFAYSGYPGSSRSTTPDNLAEDSHAAYAFLRSQISPETPIFLLGFSLGSGLATEVAPTLKPPPAGLILSEAFTSLRDAARRIVRPMSVLAHLLPDVWRTRDNVRLVPFPIFVIHSTGDALFPVTMAEEIQAQGRAAGRHIELEVLRNYPHNCPFADVPEDYWSAILGFILRLGSANVGTPPASG